MRLALNSLRVRLTLIFGGLTLATLLSVGYYIGHVASAELSKATGESLHTMAVAGANLLASNLGERQTEVLLLSQSALFQSGALDGPQVRSAVARLQQARSEYAWIGVAGPDGRVRLASGGVLEGQQVDQRPWFQAAQRGPYTGDVHEAVMLAKKLPSQSRDEPLRFVDFAAPIRDAQGRLRGVLGVHAHWRWVTDTLGSVVTPQAMQSGVDALIVNRQGDVLYPFSLIGRSRLPDIQEDQNFSALRWDDGQTYMTSRVPLLAPGNFDPGWQIVMRQPIDLALRSARALQLQLWVFGLGAALLFALLGYRLARSISQPLEQLAAVARHVERREGEPRYPAVEGSLEMVQLSRSLQGMMQTLLAREHELEQLNTGLEQMATERTNSLRSANAELEVLARKDALTGLNNRRTFDERLHEFFQRMKRSQRPFAVLLMDIDHFKKINDEHGHDGGDAVLRQFAAILLASTRATDVVARYGGEEFGVLLPETGNQAEAMAVAEKIRQAVAATTFTPVMRITVSLGVTLANASDTSDTEVLRRADTALYQSKADGRNRSTCRLTA